MSTQCGSGWTRELPEGMSYCREEKSSHRGHGGRAQRTQRRRRLEIIQTIREMKRRLLSYQYEPLRMIELRGSIVKAGRPGRPALQKGERRRFGKRILIPVRGFRSAVAEQKALTAYRQDGTGGLGHD